MPETYATKPFDQWVLGDAQAAVRDRVAADVGSQAAYDANRALIEQGDHYRNGAVVPTMDDGALRSRRVERLRREQAPNDVVNEIVDNDVWGVCGTEAAIAFVPVDPPAAPPEDADAAARAAYADDVAALDAQAAAMHDALNAAWDRAGFWDTARDGLRYAEWARRAVFRVWLPVTALERAPRPADAPADAPDPPPVLPTGKPFAEAIGLCAVSAPEPAHAHRYVQPDTQRACAIFLYQESAGAVPRDAAELWYVDGAGDTVRRVLTGDTAPGGGMAAPLALGGRLPLAEAVLPRLVVTEALRTQQDALDFDGIAGRVATRAAGFRQRASLNAQPLLVWSRTPPTDGPALRREVDADGVPWYGIEGATPLGPEEVLHLTGELVEDETTDAAGNKVTRRTMQTPDLRSEDPVPTELFTHMWDARRAIMLRAAKQGHLVGDGRAQLSGAAYVQARAAFAGKLRNHAGPFERGARDLVSAWIALALLMTDPADPLSGFLDRFRVQVTARVDAGPLTPEERAQFVAEWQAGAVSLETTQARLGIEDVRAEADALRRDPLAKLRFIKEVAATMAAIATVPDATAAMARRVFAQQGLDPGLVDAFTPQDTDGAAANDAGPAGGSVA